MPGRHLLRIESHDLGWANERVVVFGVLGGRKSGPTLLVYSPALVVCLEQLEDDVPVVVFVEGSSPDATTLATIDGMMRAMGPEDGLVQVEMPAEAIKLTTGPQVDGTVESPVLIYRGVDRSTVGSFRPPELLRTSALVAALVKAPSEEWVNPAGLVVANGGWINTYPRGLQTD